VRQAVCIDSGLLSDGRCPSRDEWFVAGTLPSRHIEAFDSVRIRRPGNGMQLAMDPRIPDHQEAFEFQLNRKDNIERVVWLLNGRIVAGTSGPTCSWPLQRGKYALQAQVWLQRQLHPVNSQIVDFVVK
jgi:penicillin-binding protein 1C